MYAYIAGLVGQPRSEPTNDLLSALVRASDEDNRRLSEEELVSLAVMPLAAGHETTVTRNPNWGRCCRQNATNQSAACPGGAPRGG